MGFAVVLVFKKNKGLLRLRLKLKLARSSFNYFSIQFVALRFSNLMMTFQAIDGKALEVKAAEARVREEVREQLEELRQEREQTAQLNSTVIKLQRLVSFHKEKLDFKSCYSDSLVCRSF